MTRFLVAALTLMMACGDTDEPVPCSADAGPSGADVPVTSIEDAGAAQVMPPAYLGGDRPAAYDLPYDYDPAVTMPMIVLLHGYSGTAAGQDLYFRLSAVTRTEGIFLLLPDGLVDASGNPFWNATDACCNYDGSEVSDVDYLSGLIEEALAHFPVDPQRVYLVGHSNGGFMSHRMACERADLIAGIASFAGSSWRDPAACQPTEGVSMLQIHGTWDLVIPYGGLTPQVGDPQGAWGDPYVCIEGGCPEPLAVCTADDACAALKACFGGCWGQWNQEACNGVCWSNAAAETQALWMDVYACALSQACYADPTWTFAGYPSAPEVAQRWAALNGCADTTAPATWADLTAEGAGAETEMLAYEGCPDGQGVALWTLVQGSHSPAVFNDAWSERIVNWLLDQVKGIPGEAK